LKMAGRVMEGQYFIIQITGMVIPKGPKILTAATMMMNAPL